MTPVFHRHTAQRGWGELLERARPLRDWRKSSSLRSLRCQKGCYLQTCYTKLSFNRVNFPTLSLCGAFQIKRNWATLSLWSVFLGQLFNISALFSTRGLRPASKRQGDPFSARCLESATAREPELILHCAQVPSWLVCQSSRSCCSSLSYLAPHVTAPATALPCSGGFIFLRDSRSHKYIGFFFLLT